MPQGPLNGCGVLSLVWGRGRAPADLGLGKRLHRCEGFCIQLLNPLLESEEAISQKRKLESRHWLDGAGPWRCSRQLSPIPILGSFQNVSNPGHPVASTGWLSITPPEWVRVLPPKHWSRKPVSRSHGSFHLTEGKVVSPDGWSYSSGNQRPSQGS